MLPIFSGWQSNSCGSHSGWSESGRTSPFRCRRRWFRWGQTSLRSIRCHRWNPEAPPVSHWRLRKRKGTVRKESAVTHFSQEFADTNCMLEHLDRAAHTICTVCWVILPWKAPFLMLMIASIRKASKSLIEPPVDHLVDFIAQFWIFPVQIRLFLWNICR